MLIRVQNIGIIKIMGGVMLAGYVAIIELAVKIIFLIYICSWGMLNWKKS